MTETTITVRCECSHCHGRAAWVATGTDLAAEAAMGATAVHNLVCIAYAGLGGRTLGPAA